MIPASIIIPIRDNDGLDYPPDQLRTLASRLLDIAGGFTRRDNVTGAWKANDGTIYHDTSFEYELSFRSWKDVTAFLDVADWARVEFRQLAIYIKIAGISEILES